MLDRRVVLHHRNKAKGKRTLEHLSKSLKTFVL